MQYLSATEFYQMKIMSTMQDCLNFLIIVQYDGITNDDYTPYMIDLVNQGSVIIPDFDCVVPDQFIDPSVPYHLYVPGSESAIMSIFGKYRRDYTVCHQSRCLLKSLLSTQIITKDCVPTVFH